MQQYPRTAEDIIKAGDLDKAHIRELLDLGREMGIAEFSLNKYEMLRIIKNRAKEKGWLPT